MIASQIKITDDIKRSAYKLNISVNNNELTLFE